MNYSLLVGAAEANGPMVHITPSGLFTIGGVTITNSMLYAVVSGIIITILSIAVRKKLTVKPRGGIIQFYEIAAEFITNLLASSLNSREKALKYAPYFVTIFLFLLFNNWLGLAPGVGDALTINGEPAFRPFTADLNGTLAVAIVSMILVQTFAIKESGFIRHIAHYFNGSLKNPVTILLGLFEMFGELVRIASLALRLFLVITVGEIIIAVFTYLGGFAAPLAALPFVILEVFIAALQAYIFVMLSIMYLAVAVKHGAEHEAGHGAEHLASLPPAQNIREISA